MALPTVRPGLRRMLEARTVAVVGASDRAGLPRLADGHRGAAQPRDRAAPGWSTRVTGPGLDTAACRRSRRCPEPVDLVLLGVPDAALVEQVRLAATARGDGGRGRLRQRARPPRRAGRRGRRAGAVRRRLHGLRQRHPRRAGARLPRAGDPLTPGRSPWSPTRARSSPRCCAPTAGSSTPLVVSSGQELVTTTADYLGHALAPTRPGSSGWCWRRCGTCPRLRAVLADAADRDVPAWPLDRGRVQAVAAALVGAHSGALAGVRRRLGGAVRGVRRAPLRRPRRAGGHPGGLRDRPAGAAPRLGRARHRDRARLRRRAGAGRRRRRAPRRALRRPCPRPRSTARRRCSTPGWPRPTRSTCGVPATDTEELFADCLAALADDAAVDVVALAVDLVPEYDGDVAFPLALERLAAHTDKPVVVLSNLSSAIDQPLAADLRRKGVPVLEGTRSGLRALGHLLAAADPVRPPAVEPVRRERRERWLARLGSGRVDPLELVADYGVPVAPWTTVLGRRRRRAGGGAARSPGGPEDREPGGHPQGRRRRRPSRPDDGPAVAAAYADLRHAPRAVRDCAASGADRGGDRPRGAPRPAGRPPGRGRRGWHPGGAARPAGRGPATRGRDSRARAPRLPEGGPAARRAPRRTAPSPSAPSSRPWSPCPGWPRSSATTLVAVDVNPLVVHPGGAVAVDALVLPAT